jgi:hypothetical protein
MLVALCLRNAFQSRISALLKLAYLEIQSFLEICDDSNANIAIKGSISDIIVVHVGRPYLLEVKRPNSCQSAEQKEFQTR